MSETAQVLPFAVPFEQWKEEGLRLGERERAGRSLLWDIGDWWNRGEAYGERVAIVEGRAPHGPWTGPAFQTCMNTASVCRAFTTSRRREGLSFKHHAEVAGLPPEDADELLDWCMEDPKEPRTTQHLRIRKQQIRRADRERKLGDKIRAVGDGIYGVIYADPPWRLEPYSRETGLNRAADNHYPTMTRDEMLDMEVMRTAPAKDCVLFCWATVPMLQEAMEWIAHYGFEYRSHFVWVKPHIGTGFWNRNQHELLLVGVRGDVPCPAPGEQYSSVIEAPTAAHSTKPEAVAEMIEEMFPTLPALEMFARKPRLGWTVWGNEA